jgi:hypothetical protein
MITATLIITSKDKPSSHDDTITISAVEDSRAVFEVVYSTPDWKVPRTFTTRDLNVLDYIEDTLKSLSYDVDPFQAVQLYTSVHPSVMYHIADMSDPAIRRLILNQIRDAMRFRTVS